MSNITASMVAQLRERTGLGMMECKKALTQTEGDIDAAVRLLQEKGVKDRGERVAGEGLIMAHVAADKKVGVLVEINSETDFVARNDDFKALCRSFAEKIAASSAADSAGFLAEGDNQEVLDEATKRIGEKLVLGRFVRMNASDNATVTAYVHNPGGPQTDGGKVGVLVEVAGTSDETLARELAMHISFAKPKYLSEETVPAEIIANFREIETARTAQDPKMVGKPQAAIDGVVTGRVKKAISEIALLSQPYVRDDKKTVGQLIKETAGASLVQYACFQVGENVAK